ncbi:hypothetical protein DSL92_04390 [Billgrantia gudaonensis]|uniref:Uncharacterized protein n=1 Tax=Billgrantia gudaonensis TaxID=376427 RepID=A0A432JJF9_9GAMM|nr:hypothetical protein DSL92_04390 [Halomonas gudaonensis]
MLGDWQPGAQSEVDRAGQPELEHSRRWQRHDARLTYEATKGRTAGDDSPQPPRHSLNPGFQPINIRHGCAPLRRSRAGILAPGSRLETHRTHRPVLTSPPGIGMRYSAIRSRLDNKPSNSAETQSSTKTSSGCQRQPKCRMAQSGSCSRMDAGRWRRGVHRLQLDWPPLLAQSLVRASLSQSGRWCDSMRVPPLYASDASGVRREEPCVPTSCVANWHPARPQAAASWSGLDRSVMVKGHGIGCMDNCSPGSRVLSRTGIVVQSARIEHGDDVMDV